MPTSADDAWNSFKFTVRPSVCVSSKKVHKCKFVPFLREVGVRGFTRKMAHMGHGQADTPRTSFQGKGTKCVCTNRIKTCAFEVRVRGRTSKTIKHAFITLVNKMSLPRVVLRISRAS